MVYGGTSHNRTVYASPPDGGSGWSKRRKQPERYTTCLQQYKLNQQFYRRY
jgi:hypothetical protein